jgi:GT2 family glycosyltransferase
MVREEFPQVHLIANADNRGFAKANNQAIKEARGDYILLLNPDMKPGTDTFARMLSWFMQNENAWVASCRLISPSGETITNVRRFPTLWDQMLIVLKIPHILPSVLAGYLCSDLDYGQAHRVDSVRGGFFMLNLKNFRSLPLLDERYFLWFEEVDFCKQVRQMGGEVWYTPVATCIDLFGQSFSQVKRFQTQRYFRDSMLKYFRKWHTLPAFLLLFVAWTPMIALSWLVDLLGLKGRAKT